MNIERNTMSKLATSLRPLFSFGWRMLLTLTVSRVIFVAWQWQRVADAEMLEAVFVQGFRFDLVLLGLMLTIPVLAFPILASNRLLVPAWRALLKVCLPVALLIIVFMECGTPSFVDQLDSRPNILFLEYLNQPREVAATLWGAYKLPIISAVLFATTITWVNSRQIGRLVGPITPTGVIPAILVTPFLIIICFGLIRSTLEPEGGFRNTQRADDDVVAQVRESMMIEPQDFTSSTLPTLHRQGLPDPTR